MTHADHQALPREVCEAMGWDTDCGPPRGHTKYVYARSPDGAVLCLALGFNDHVFRCACVDWLLEQVGSLRIVAGTYIKGMSVQAPARCGQQPHKVPTTGEALARAVVSVKRAMEEVE